MDPRSSRMADLYRSGKTLREIGLQYRISHERVRQLIKRDIGIPSAEGGQAVKNRKNLEARKAKRLAHYLRRFGCYPDQKKSIPRLACRAYSQQRRNANTRGIPWEFHLWSWWTVWKDSGKWDSRGRGQGYVMCRKYDSGPYSPENVEIAPQRVNLSTIKANRVGPHLPLGVKRNGRTFIAKRIVNGSRTEISGFKTPMDAHEAYIQIGVASGVEM